MAYKILNRVKMTVSGTPGTGAVTLGSAVAGFADFSNAGISNGDTLPYVIEDGTNYEIGVGTYSTTGPTLTRTTITQSYNGSTYGTTSLTLTSGAIVMLSPLAADMFSARSYGTGVQTALGNATNGANGLVVEDSNGNTSIAGMAVMGHSFKRNRIINGNMMVWQRSTSSVALTNAVAYGTADRWFAVMDTTAAGTWQQSTSAPTSPNISQYSMRIGRNSSSTSTNTIRMYQIVESVNCYDLAGQTVVVSFYAKAGANYSSSGSALNLQIIQGTGVDQSAANMYSGNWTGTSTTNNSSTITTSWARYTYSFTVGSSTSEIAIGFTYNPTGTAGADDNVYITGVQLETGSIATPYERQIFSEQLAQCQRYYESTAYPNAGFDLGSTRTVIVLSTTSTTNGLPFLCTKRTSPTITIYSRNGNAGKVSLVSSGLDISGTSSAVNFNATGIWGITLGTAQTAGVGVEAGWTASAEL